jgi:hypothetical protein
MDLFITWTEDYRDPLNNLKSANHGELLLDTYEGGEVPANRSPVTFSLSQQNLFDMYQSVTFDYEDDNGVVPVFNSPIGAGRDQGRDTVNFVVTDHFSIRWELTTDDGRVFGKYGNGWSASVCTELPGSNCSIDFGVGCATEIEDPGADGGQWIIDLYDSYGDGWNGAFLTVDIDDDKTDYGMAGGSYIQHVISVPASASSLTFEYTGGDWDSEVTFTITSPRNNIVANIGPSPLDGTVTLYLCED